MASPSRDRNPRSLSPSAFRQRWTFVLLGMDLVLLAVLAGTSGYTGPGDPWVLVSLGDVYGLLAAGFLYLTLLVSPLALAFPRLPGKERWFLARRGLGLSSLVFALPHALVSFFGPLAGFGGVPYLDPYTGWALVLGVVAFVILLVLGATASDRAQRALGPARWKALHRLVYGAGVLVFLHLLLVGTHYGQPHSPWMFWTLAAVGFLVFLQALRVDQWRAKKFPKERRYGPASLLAVALVTAAWFWTSADPVGAAPGGTRWITGHHGLVLPAPAPAGTGAQP